MSTPITDIEILKKYLKGVMERADHHANSVNEVALAIAGAIIWRKDPAPIKVLAKDGDMKNVLWVNISRKRHAFVYSHSTGNIEIRQDSMQGTVLHALNNTTTLSQVRSIFDSL